MKMRIREAKNGDFEGIVDLFMEYGLYEHRLDKNVKICNRNEVRKSELEHVSYGTRYFVAEDGGKILGVLNINIDKRGREKIGVLHTLIVTEKARKKGIGKALVKYVLDLMKKEGCKRAKSFVHHANKKALGFWKNEGFDGELGYGISRRLR